MASATEVSRAQANKAVDALLKHHDKVTSEREDTELLPREEHVWLVVNTKRGTTKQKLMPKRIQLPNPPLPAPPATTVGLITKPPQRTYKDLLASPEHNIKFVNRVVDTDKLRGKWKPYEARRNLARENDLWLADERIVPSLPKLLGKVFFGSKKVPIPVNLSRKDLKAELGRAINSTYFHPSTGTSHSVRIATPGATSAQATLDNLLAAIPLVVANIDDGWDNILSIGIKTSSSVLLPVWNSKLEGRFEKSIVAAAEDESMEESSKSNKVKGKGKEKKRGADDEVVAEKVEKKAKAAPAKAKEVQVEAAPAPAPAVKKTKAVSKADKVTAKTGKKTSSVNAEKRSKKAALGKSK